MSNNVSAITYCRNKWLEIKERIFGFKNDKTHAGSIYRNMAILAAGSLAARAIGFVTVPVITRIYTPEHFGVLSVFASLTAMMVPLSTMRYSAAIPLPKRDETATNLFALCLISLCCFSLLLAAVLWMSAQPLLHLFSMERLVSYWWLVVVAVAGTGLFEILSSWATREKAFKALAKRAIWQSTSSAIVKICLGLLGFKPIGLLIGHVLSQAGGCASLSFGFFRKLKTNFRHVTTKRLSFLLRRYADYPKFRLPSQFLLVFSSNAPLLFSAMLFGKETTGQLGLALTTLALPITLIGNTTGQAFYAEIAKIGRKQPHEIHKVTKNIAKKLFISSLAPFFVLATTGPYFFEIIFGEQWHDAGVFARICSVYLLAQFVATPLVNVLNVFEKQGVFFNLNAVRAAMVTFSFGLSYVLSVTSFQAIMIYTLVMTLNYVLNTYVIFNTISRESQSNMRHV
jgi:O-antigen/teichoic acid export membrane protein